MNPPVGTGREAGRRVAKLRKVLESWGPSSGRTFPWRHAEDAYQRLLAEVLLQRTRADAVASVWREVVYEFPTAFHLASASEAKIEETIRSLGLSRKRTPYLKNLGRALVEAGEIPLDLGALSRLTGIGSYSAAAFLISWKGFRGAPVDSNTRRVLGRVVLGVHAADRETTRVLANRLMARGVPATLLFGLLDLGARPCRPRRPMCDRCPAQSFCMYASRRTTSEVMDPARRAVPAARRSALTMS